MSEDKKFTFDEDTLEAQREKALSFETVATIG